MAEKTAEQEFNENEKQEFKGYTLNPVKYDHDPKHLHWSVKDEHGQHLADINRASWKGSGKYLYITNTELEIENCRFNTVQNAFYFVVGVARASKKQVETRPLPEEVMEFLNERARTLRDRSQKLHMDALDLESEKYRLLKLAQKHGVDKAEIYIGDSDAEAAVDELLDFKVQVEFDKYNENGEVVGTEWEEVPFFSESCLYELIGKDQARSVLGRMRRIIGKIAPNKVQRL